MTELTIEQIRSMPRERIEANLVDKQITITIKVCPWCGQEPQGLSGSCKCGDWSLWRHRPTSFIRDLSPDETAARDAKYREQELARTRRKLEALERGEDYDDE